LAIFAGFDSTRNELLLATYLGREPTTQEAARFERCAAIRAFFEFVWAVVKIAGGTEFSEYRDRMYASTKSYLLQQSNAALSK
jgi:hypothetical protein